MRRNCYMYEGPVTSYGRVVEKRYCSTTYATTKEKALSNFRYRWNKCHKRLATSQVEFPGKLTLLEGF